MTQLSLFKNQPLIHDSLSKSSGSYKNGSLSNKLKNKIEKLSGINFRHFILGEQVHSTNILIIKDKMEQRFKTEIPAIDGLITNQRGILLLIKHADCTPIFLFDPNKKVAGLVHSGWKGTLGKIGLMALAKMITEFNCRADDILVGLGPAAQKCCYGPSKNQPSCFLCQLPEWQDFILEKDLKWHIDLSGFIKKTFLDMGIRKSHIEVSNICTICNHSYHSYTRQRDKQEPIGKGISFIGLKP